MKKIISIMMAVLMLASMMSAIGVSAAVPNSSLDRYKITLDPGHGLTSNGWDGADGATDWGGEVEDSYISVRQLYRRLRRIKEVED